MKNLIILILCFFPSVCSGLTNADYLTKINLVKDNYLDALWDSGDGQYEEGGVAFTWLNAFMAETIAILAGQGDATAADKLRAKAVYEKRLRIAHDEKKKALKNKFLLTIKRFIGMNKERALIFNDNGDLETIINILPVENEFNFKGNKYMVDRDKITTKIKLTRLLEIETYYFYNINCVTPLTIGTPINSLVLDPKEFGAIMDTKQLINLNKPTSSLSGLFETNMKWVLIGGACVIAYFLFGGGGA